MRFRTENTALYSAGSFALLLFFLFWREKKGRVADFLLFFILQATTTGAYRTMSGVVCMRVQREAAYSSVGRPLAECCVCVCVRVCNVANVCSASRPRVLPMTDMQTQRQRVCVSESSSVRQYVCVCVCVWIGTFVGLVRSLDGAQENACKQSI